MPEIEGGSPRERVLIELLRLYNDLASPMQGPAGIAGDGDSLPLMPSTYTASVRELERLLTVMRADARSIHWHVSEYFIRCTTRNATVWEKRKAKGGKTLSVEVRKIVYVRDNAIRLEKVRRGVSWLADHWNAKAIGEPMLPSAVLEEAA